MRRNPYQTYPKPISKKREEFSTILFMILVTVILLFSGIVAYITEYNYILHCTEPTTAIVTGSERKSTYSSVNKNFTTSYYPVLEYTVGDKTYSTVYHVGNSYRKYLGGEVVSIKYNPDNPVEIVMGTQGMKTILVFLGVVLSGAAIIFVLLIQTYREK